MASQEWEVACPSFSVAQRTEDGGLLLTPLRGLWLGRFRPGGTDRGLGTGSSTAGHLVTLHTVAPADLMAGGGMDGGRSD